MARRAIVCQASTLQLSLDLSTISLVMRVAKIVIAMLCIVCVLALCIAPYVDIPFTVLKALQDVLLIFSLLIGALALVNLFHQVLVRCALMPSDYTTLTRSLFSPLEANCVLQC